MFEQLAGLSDKPPLDHTVTALKKPGENGENPYATNPAPEVSDILEAAQ
jgi:hypothetical protein